MTEKELTIQKYMEKLGLTLEEAEELYADEQADNLPELSAEQKSVVREMTQADRKKAVFDLSSGSYARRP